MGLRIGHWRALAAGAVALAAASGSTALAAGAGQTFLTGGLSLPAGAIAGATSGYSGDSPSRIGVSSTGRYVAFVSDADTLAPGVHPDVTNVFRKDRQTGAVVLVGRATGLNGAVPLRPGIDPQISDDGTRVAWMTGATLTPADTDGGASDVYVRDIPTATTYLASQGTGGTQTLTDVAGFALSGNGQFVAFDADEALAGASDANGARDVYRRDIAAATSTLVSRNSGGVNAANGASFNPGISGDGRWVAYSSQATDVVGGYVAGSGSQIFARNMSTGSHHLVSSQTSATTTGGNGSSSQPQIAGSPNDVLANVYVAYTSTATNVAAGGVDGDAQASVYRRQLSATSSELVSRATGGASANSRAHDASISDSGQRVAFTSDATNLGGPVNYYGVYVRDFTSGTTVLGSTQTEYSVWGTLSGDGTVIAWFEGEGLTPDIDPDLAGVYARTYAPPPGSLGAVAPVSRPPGSAPFLASAFEVESARPGERTISADGRYVVFKSWSRRLPGNAAGLGQIYRRDTLTGALELISRENGAGGAPAVGFSDSPTMSADGNRVAFATGARLVPEDVDSLGSVYVRDVAARTTTLVSRASSANGALANSGAGSPAISADGRHVAFRSAASNLGAPGGDQQVYVRRLATHLTVLASRANGGGGAVADNDVHRASISGDGRLVVFSTPSTNLHADDPPGDFATDIYVRDTIAGTTTLVSRRSGAGAPKATSSSSDPVISSDGRVVAFRAEDQALAPEAGPWGGSSQVVARDLATHANTLVSRAPGGAPANASAEDPSIDGDGSVVAFVSDATNLLPGRGGSSRRAVFARTTAGGGLSGPPAFGLLDNGDHAIGPSLSDDGQCMAFSAHGHNAVTGTAGDFRTAYVHVISGSCPKPLPATKPAATRKPRLSRVSMTNRRFRAGRKRTARIAAKRKRRAPVGTRFRFTLDARANVTIRFHKQAPGRRAGRACRKPTPKLRKRKRCTRFVLTGAIARRGLDPGRRSIAFSGRIGKRKLRPGRYRATIYAANSGGRSNSVRLSFRVVRR